MAPPAMKDSRRLHDSECFILPAFWCCTLLCCREQFDAVSIQQVSSYPGTSPAWLTTLRRCPTFSPTSLSSPPPPTAASTPSSTACTCRGSGGLPAPPSGTPAPPFAGAAVGRPPQHLSSFSLTTYQCLYST